MHPFVRPCRSHSPLWLHYPLLFPLLSFPFKFNNLPAVCFSRDSLAAPLAQRQTVESVGNLTQHKLRCEAEVSESVGCVYPDRASVEIGDGGLNVSLQFGGRVKRKCHGCDTALGAAKKLQKRKYRFCVQITYFCTDA